ncbi:hypothetical protein [Streptomyces sp. GESEQ-35]|uniref:hypothetical protein n=1 Tax=Streptomyces sp. GESEQ-35 TaxID=2812657 RepID=UPI001B33332E|nr:hypothetical protein [Streptomyces sp. GESEQ-35]
MSRPSEYGNAHPEGEDPQEAPNVYHPQAPATPVYDEYADPAAAHGWQDGAFDDTAQLPPVADGEPAGRSGHRGRHRPLGLRSRRAMVAAGAVGVVSAAALIAAFSFSGSSSGDGEGNHGRTGSATAGESTEPAEAGTATGSAPKGTPDAVTPSGTASTSPTPEESRATGEPSSGAATTQAPSVTASQSAPGNSDGNPGKGQGSTKKPR